MKKLIPLMIAIAVTFGAVTVFSSPTPQPSKTTKPNSTKHGAKPKATKKAY